MADNVSVNPGTTTPIATDDVAGIQFQKVKLNLGGDGVDGGLWDGKMQGGTINAGTVVVSSLSAGTITRLEGGTVGLITRVSTIGTLEVGTISTLPNLPGGSITVTLGTVVGTVTTNMASGTLNLGTTAVSSLPNIPGGTVGLITRISTIGTLEVGTISTLPNIPGGTIGLITTLSTLTSLSGGTITKVEGGTVSVNMLSGTLNVGTTTVTGNVGGTIAVSAGTLQTHYAEDAGHTTGDKGELIFAVRNDGGTVLSGTDLDYTPLSTDAAGALRITGTVATGAGTQPVRIIDGTVTSLSNLAAGTVTRLEQGSINVTAGTVTNLLKVEDAGHTTGDSGVMLLGVRVDGGTSLVGTDLDYAPFQMDAAGALRITGTVATGAGTQPVRIIDGTTTLVSTVTTVTSVTNLAAGTITKLEQGSINVTAGTITAGTITNLLKAEDAGHSTGDSGVMTLAVRVDGGTTLAGTDLDYAPLMLDANGALRTTGTVTMLSAGTITKVEGGTIGVVTSITGVASGTINNSGTTTGVGVVSLLSAGTITKLEGGTVGLVTTVSTLTSLSGGTITKLEGGTVSTNMLSGTLNLGTVNVSTGTITSVTNLAGGTVQVNPKPTRSIFNYGTVTSGTIGTLVAAPGAGTAIWINDVSAQVYSGTVEPLVSWALATQGGGAAGGGVIIRGQFVGGGGQQKTPTNAFNGGTTNAALTFNILSGSGTVAYMVSYWVE